MSFQLPDDWTEERKAAWHKRQAAYQTMEAFDNESRNLNRQRDDERRVLEAAYVDADRKLKEISNG